MPKTFLCLITSLSVLYPYAECENIIYNTEMAKRKKKKSLLCALCRSTFKTERSTIFSPSDSKHKMIYVNNCFRVFLKRAAKRAHVQM